MGKKNRVPMQVAPEFMERIKNLQSKIMKKEGKLVSIRDITGKLPKMPEFQDIEDKLINGKDMDKIEFKIKLDKRML